MNRARPLFVVLTLAYAGILIAVAFLVWEQGSNCPWYAAAAVFFPAGALLQLALGPRRWWAAIGFAVLGAAWVEAAQAIWMPLGYGRIEDAIWGAIGAAAGVAVGAMMLRSMHSHESFRIMNEASTRETPRPPT